jgi:type I site-specific restriction-modification system R (restriction) subunit
MKHTKMLVVTASDYGKTDDNNSNAHAREMRRQIENAIGLDPLLSNQDLSIEICTSVSENGETDDKALEKIKRFGLTKTDKEGNEPIDVLIVKGMGLVGLDVPQCKILLDASTFRRGPIKNSLPLGL